MAYINGTQHISAIHCVHWPLNLLIGTPAVCVGKTLEVDEPSYYYKFPHAIHVLSDTKYMFIVHLSLTLTVLPQDQRHQPIQFILSMTKTRNENWAAKQPISCSAIIFIQGECMFCNWFEVVNLGSLSRNLEQVFQAPKPGKWKCIYEQYFSATMQQFLWGQTSCSGTKSLQQTTKFIVKHSF